MPLNSCVQAVTINCIMLDLPQRWRAQSQCLASSAIVTRATNCINPRGNGLLLDPAWSNSSRNGPREESCVLSKPWVPSTLLRASWQCSQVRFTLLKGSPRAGTAQEPQGRSSRTSASPGHRAGACPEPPRCWAALLQGVGHPGDQTAAVCEGFFLWLDFPLLSHLWFLCTDVLPSLIHCLALVEDPAGFSSLTSSVINQFLIAVCLHSHLGSSALPHTLNSLFLAPCSLFRFPVPEAKANESCSHISSGLQWMQSKACVLQLFLQF